MSDKQHAGTTTQNTPHSIKVQVRRETKNDTGHGTACEDASQIADDGEADERVLHDNLHHRTRQDQGERQKRDE